MIQQFEFSEFIVCFLKKQFLKKQKDDTVIYDMKKLKTIADQIKKKYPEIRIDTGKQSILRFVSQSDYITLKGNKITINNLSSLSIRCVIAHNLPSKTTQNIFTNAIIK